MNERSWKKSLSAPASLAPRTSHQVSSLYTLLYIRSCNYIKLLSRVSVSRGYQDQVTTSLHRHRRTRLTLAAAGSDTGSKRWWWLLWCSSLVVVGCCGFVTIVIVVGAWWGLSAVMLGQCLSCSWSPVVVLVVWSLWASGCAVIGALWGSKAIVVEINPQYPAKVYGSIQVSVTAVTLFSGE